ncbi:hypothetical protein EW145_g3687 [Phellinidium pouzarii]|uniref:Eukaryotic translation initiation factor 3 subunit L n=1 Tax=Phellinidium pouzarii TaxID=167371 RepID=A0A4S4LBG4_9AGAM|nr:hypothetical protein EW145_g3687 [Phellinidium pouzarii]
MAEISQQRKPIWATDAEIDEDLQDVDLSHAIGNYVQNDIYDDAQSQIDSATLAAMQQQMAQQAAFAQIPDVVKRFIMHFHQAVINNNLEQISVAYESGWNRLTEKYYAKTEWPEAEVIAPLVNDDPIFLILYRELYYRHVYSRLSPDIDDRFHSYENSCELFNYLLNSDGPVSHELPDQWLWDILDEFIYQFQSFSVWRSKVKNKSEEELLLLADGSQIWSCYSVLNVLYSLIQKSKINEYIVATREGRNEKEIAEIVGEYGQRPLYRMLGYFSIICLLRVHVLLGDFTLALKVMENVELNQKAPLTRVTACHVSTYYYVGFCYMAMRRYPDAIRIFVAILNFIMRMRRYHTRSYQYDQINKTADRMYALFTLCNALAPSRLDDNILNTVKERYGEQVARMARGVADDALPAFEELFIYACPKFIAANPPPFEDPEALAVYIADPPMEPVQRHLSLFLGDVRAQASAPTLRSFLKLYASLDAHKLAGFLDADEEEMVQQMMVLKQCSRRIGRVGSSEGGRGGLLDGEMITTSDLDFVIDDNMVHIVEATVGRRYASWFIRNTEHAQRVLDTLKATPLPKPPPAPAVDPSASAAAALPAKTAPKSSLRRPSTFDRQPSAIVDVGVVSVPEPGQPDVDGVLFTSAEKSPPALYHHHLRVESRVRIAMFSKLGTSKKKETKENGVVSRSTTPIPSRPTTPRPPGEPANFRSGMLTIVIFSGRGLVLPTGAAVPDVIQKALRSAPADRPPRNKRESTQRKRHWWLPYVVLEFDKNEILIDALDGDLGAPTWNHRAHFDVSRTSNIIVSAYLRTAQCVQGHDDMGNDLLMGRVEITPALDAHHVSDQWYVGTGGMGEFHLQIAFKPSAQSLTIETFDLLKVIGKGSFGKVMQVRKKDTQRVYALKTIRKAHIASRPGEITHILAERTVLALVNNPFIVPLKFSFQNPDKLYLVMSFVNGGELFYHLQREGKFDENRSRFYAAELLCALEHLHGFNVVYRDLKPENILLDYTGHIALCDFGLCKLNMSETEKTNTFCGTPEYIAPELLESQGYTKTVDWWTLGVLLYEMMANRTAPPFFSSPKTGLPPFYDENVNEMYQRILRDPLLFPPDMSHDAKSLMTGLLQRDPSNRLGHNGADEIKRHPFFSRHVDWNKLLAKKIQPPFKPSVESVLDVANFDSEFTSETATDSVVLDSQLSETVQDQFRGFTYNPEPEHLSASVSYA